MTIATAANCPACNADLRYEVDGKTYSHVIGVEYEGGYDGVSEWECPDCGYREDRFTGEPIGEAA